MASDRFPFKIALNASTLFPFKLDIKQQIQVAAEAGYQGIEVWVKDLDAYLSEGGSIADLRSYITASGLSVVNAIAFFPWADSDPATRAAGLVQAEREMRMLAELGCPAVAAPPFGAVKGNTLTAMASYFAELDALASTIGVTPYLEFWGRADVLSRLSEALFIAIESGRPNIKLLLDPFHMYTGGTELNSLSYLNGATIGIVHVNDYPAVPQRTQVTDSERLFPGAGIAPTQAFAQLLHQAGYRGYLSLELFIEDYAAEQALDVARRGLAAVQQAYRLA